MDQILDLSIDPYLKRVLKWIVPPICISSLERLLYGRVVYEGPLQSYEEGVRLGDGYDTDLILKKVLEASLKVKSGDASYERDSVVFHKSHIDSLILIGMLKGIQLPKGTLNVLDFGGSLGSKYFQHKKFLSHTGLSWSVIEQPHFVEAGNTYLADDELKFYPTIEAYLEHGRPDVVLFSSVLQYLDDPFYVLQKCLELSPKMMVLDRTTFSLSEEDEVYLQKVPSKIYSASYPVRALGAEVCCEIKKSYDLIHEENSSEGVVLVRGKPSFLYKNLLFQKRTD